MVRKGRGSQIRRAEGYDHSGNMLPVLTLILAVRPHRLQKAAFIALGDEVLAAQADCPEVRQRVPLAEGAELDLGRVKAVCEDWTP